MCKNGRQAKSVRSNQIKKMESNNKNDSKQQRCFISLVMQKKMYPKIPLQGQVNHTIEMFAFTITG